MALSNPHAATVRYEPDEHPPHGLALALALQLMMLELGEIILIPVVVVRAAGGADTYLAWAAFAALAISGITTMLQARRVGRIGSGYILLMVTSGAFIAVCVTALTEGGPGLLMTLLIASSLFQFLLAWRLSLLRRIITPTVAGTVLMLIAVTIMPVVAELLEEVPEGASEGGIYLCAAATLLVTLVMMLRGSSAVRRWAPISGVVLGCVVASFFGLYEVDRVAEAAWFGLPQGGWPGFDFTLGPAFWALLPAFVFVTLVGAIETVGDVVGIQKVSWRKPRATDFRSVQGAVAADGVGNLLSGLAGTVPNTTCASGVATVEVTGVASRRVGIYIGLFFLALTLLPKALALFLAIPGPVAASYLLVMIAILFSLGMRIVVQDGMDFRKAAIVGVAFWIGTGFQHNIFFPGGLEGWAGELLGNGMAAGGLAALVMTAFLELTSPRRTRIETELNTGALRKIDEVLGRMSSKRGWGEEMVRRLRLVAEETIETLSSREVEGADGDKPRRLRLVIRPGRAGAEMEFVASLGEGNLEDRLALIGERPAEGPVEHEISLRLLRHFASSVRHQQYLDTDIVTVKIA
ncbi:MAG: purine/pyrimidine permease [Gemmatimonadota bacterium]|nr:purine/pyrimidine permease [Gemmatimonadota bacterium]